MLSKQICLLFTTAVILSCPLPGVSTVPADPDHPSSGYEFNGVPFARVGTRLEFSHIDISGLIEVRNEERFDQSLFPNHNWRGFMAAYGKSALWGDTTTGILAAAGLEHHSGHPTMGMESEPAETYHLLYDGTYRRQILNSVVLRLSGSLTPTRKTNFQGVLDYQFYFRSKNTPELSCMDLSHSHGFSVGTNFRISLSRVWSCNLSVFDRYIFRGAEGRRDTMCIPDDEYPYTTRRDTTYPVINGVNTVTAKLGVNITFPETDRTLSLYTRILYGNIFGFVDSREKRKLLGVGFEVY